jgi:hypothetical protein
LGRNCKEAFDFFPLFTDFFENDKIKKLRRAYGAIGILTYLNILCRIYGGRGYYFKAPSVPELVDDITEQILGKKDRPSHVSSQVAATIRYLIEQDILDRDLLEQSVISGRAMQEQYSEMSAKAKRKAEIGIYRLVDVNVSAPENSISSEEMPISSEEIPIDSEKMQQSKVKYNTTTTDVSIAHTRVNEDSGNSDPIAPPMVYEVAKYMRDDLCLDEMLKSFKEAERFMLYNEKRGWDCLPDWKHAAKVWCTRVD